MPLQTPAKSWPEGYTGQIRAIASGEKILENHPDWEGFMEKLFMHAIETFDVAYGD